MDYLWTDYSPENIYALATEPRDALCEALPTFGGIHYINPLARLQDVFIPLLNVDWSGEELPRGFVEDLLLHSLAWLDNLSGVRPSTLAQSKIAQKLLGGSYGEEAGKIFQSLDQREKKTILHLLQQKHGGIGEDNYFPEAIRAFYPAAKAMHNEDDGCLIVLLPMSQSVEQAQKIVLLEDLFLPLGYLPVRYFWAQRIGLIENPATMNINHITLY